MARILITDLSVDTEYGIQVRSQRDGHVSEWSNYLNVTTAKDLTAPGDPTGLTFVVVGGSFVANWVPPTANMDGSALDGDLKDYVVTITTVNNAMVMTRVYYTEKTSFELTAEANKATFFDYQTSLSIRVQSRDFKNNVSTPGATATVAKSAPNPVTSLTAGIKGASFTLDWTKPTQNTDSSDFTDFKNFNVVVTDGSYSRTLTTTDSSMSLTFDEIKAIFGQMKYTVTFKVSVVNATGGESTQVQASATKPAPGPPTGLSWAVAPNAAFSGSWTAPTGVDDLAGYDVTVSATVSGNALNSTFKVTDTQFVLTRQENTRIFGIGVIPTPAASITISVKSRDSLGQLSTAATATAGNPAPAAPTGVTATGGTDSVTVSWTAPADTDLTRYEVYTAPTSGGTLTYQGQVSANTTQLTFTSVAYSQSFFVAVKAFDEFNSASPAAYSGSSVAPNSPFTVDTTPPSAVSGLTVTAPTGRTSAQSSAILLSWTANTATDLAGYQIRYSSSVTPRVWIYLDVVDKTATSALVEGLSSNSTYVAQIRPYDTMINTPAWSAEASGTSTTSIQPPQDISSTISILTGGTLRSANYDSTAGTGWLLQSSGLDIQGGAINARVITAGTLKSSSNVTYDGTTQPAWSMNLAGNMSVNDAQVRGKIVVGNSAATNNANVNIASYNYGGTGNQWAIKGDGSLEFRYGSSTSTRVQIGSAGFEAWNGGTQTVLIGTDGTAKFAGNLSGSTISNNGGTFAVTAAGAMTAYSGVIGGWTIGTSTLSNAGLRLDATNGMIDAGSGTTRIGMKAGVGFWAGSDNLNSASPFFVSTAGALSATNASLSGSFSSSNGNFTVNTSGTVTASGNLNVYGHIEVGASSSSTDAYAIVRHPSTGAWVMLDGRSSTSTAIASSSGNFSVSYDGNLTAYSAIISGNITATSGTFTGTVNASGGTFSGTVYGGTFEGSLFNTGPSSSARVSMGPGTVQSLDGTSYPAVYFQDAFNGTASGVAGGSNYMYLYANGGNTRMQLFSTQMNFTINGSPVGTWTGGGLAMGGMIGLEGVTGQAVGQGTGLGDKIGLYSVQYGIGIQPSAVVIYQGSTAGTYFMVNSGNVQRSSADRTIAGNFRPIFASAFTVGSLASSKTNVRDLAGPRGANAQEGHAISKIRQLRPVEFDSVTRTDLPKKHQRTLSLIAEEVAAVIPEAASYHVVLSDEKVRSKKNHTEIPVQESDMKLIGVDVNAMATLAIAGVKELISEIDDLKAQVAKLTAK